MPLGCRKPLLASIRSTRHSPSDISVEVTKGAVFSSVVESVAPGGATVSTTRAAAHAGGPRPAWQIGSRRKVVRCSKCGRNRARGRVPQREGLSPSCSEFHGCCCLKIMDSVVRHVSCSGRCSHPPRSLVRGELLLQQVTHPFYRA